jgi:hypothetical protein
VTRAANSLRIGSSAQAAAAAAGFRTKIVNGRLLFTTNFALAVARGLATHLESGKRTKLARADSRRARERTAAGAGQQTETTKGTDGAWKDILGRTSERVQKELPKKLGDAAVDAITGIIRHSPKSLLALAAGLVVWLTNLSVALPVLAGIGAWLSYLTYSSWIKSATRECLTSSLVTSC